MTVENNITNQFKLDSISFFVRPPSIPSQQRTPQTTAHPSRACLSIPACRPPDTVVCRSHHPPLRARPMADDVRPLSTGWVETSDGEQHPSWKPLPLATPPVPLTHATGHSAFRKRCQFSLGEVGAFPHVEEVRRVDQFKIKRGEN